MFLVLTLCNEVLDVPHLLMGDEPTAISQRSSEVFIEICIFVIVVLIEILVMEKLLGRINLYIDVRNTKCTMHGRRIFDVSSVLGFDQAEFHVRWPDSTPRRLLPDTW
jgi:hypothetical protein